MAKQKSLKFATIKEIVGLYPHFTEDMLRHYARKRYCDQTGFVKCMRRIGPKGGRILINVELFEKWVNSFKYKPKK
jgi:hypothetical protein